MKTLTQVSPRPKKRELENKTSSTTRRSRTTRMFTDLKRYPTKIVNMPNNKVKYVTQAVLGFTVILFSAYMLITSDSDANQAVWVGLIASVTGVFLPHPTPSDPN